MNLDVALSLRDQLREARAVALKDGEAFDQLVHVVERIGVYMTGTIGNLGEYSEPITQLACISPLAIDIPVQLPLASAPSTVQGSDPTVSNREHTKHAGYLPHWIRNRPSQCYSDVESIKFQEVERTAGIHLHLVSLPESRR